MYFFNSKNQKFIGRTPMVGKKNEQKKPVLARSATSLGGTRKNESNVGKGGRKKDERPVSSKTDNVVVNKDKMGETPRKEDGKTTDEDERKFECHGMDRELADMLGTKILKRSQPQFKVKSECYNFSIYKCIFEHEILLIFQREN